MIDSVYLAFSSIINSHSSFLTFILMFTPFVVFFEGPLLLFIIIGIFKFAKDYLFQSDLLTKLPPVSCCITCYSEGISVINTIKSLTFQTYPGLIEIIAVIDGALQNKDTLQAAQSCKELVDTTDNRKLIIIPKWQRGGKISSLNVALKIASGEIFIALDGDTSFDNDMVVKAVNHFNDENVIAVAGNLRVRNASKSLATRLQALEYILSISAGKAGLSAFGIVNNISGAFGVFRKKVLDLVGGWNTGSAEDLDLTIRIKQYFGRNKNWRIVFDPYMVGHTDVPETFLGYFKQRIRWEGDLFYIIGRKYLDNIRPGFLNWINYFSTIIITYFMQIILPFVIILYTIFLFYTFPTPYVIALFLIVYIFYLLVLSIYFLLYFLLISDRLKEDIVYFFYIPLFPLFAFVSRMNTALAIFHSIINKSHLDSNIAPWWVLRKGRF
ncbi:N-acetylglucosaminyltransferase [Thermodesulfobium acidiphilum]|uniref:N-acetylglucosaminyltransferase n=1 Tax=Thermodesulfobium acidiphilum TaxID=1794699 RepID=A0A2R4W0Y4_THEAF|nr:glycosyltransferase [Thermodesulfobium acidiphilum]AWB10374.1 N-acetylglucosaminyltransferase [Thermodesulfobium acidiphilum]